MAGGVPILGTVTKPCFVEQIDKTTFRIVLTQGLNRQIRRMCEYFDYRVCSLLRVRIMNINLGRLKVGTWRNLTEQELFELNHLLKNSSNQSMAEVKSDKGSKCMPLEGIAITKKIKSRAKEKKTKEQEIKRGKPKIRKQRENRQKKKEKGIAL